MAELLPTYSWQDILKVVDMGRLKELKSCEVIVAGESFLLLNPSTDYIKMQAEYKAQLSNSVGGKNIEEILNETSHSEKKWRDMNAAERKVYQESKMVVAV